MSRARLTHVSTHYQKKKSFQEHFIVIKEDETYIKGVFFQPITVLNTNKS